MRIRHFWGWASTGICWNHWAAKGRDARRDNRDPREEERHRGRGGYDARRNEATSVGFREDVKGEGSGEWSRKKS